MSKSSRAYKHEKRRREKRVHREVSKDDTFAQIAGNLARSIRKNTRKTIRKAR